MQIAEPDYVARVCCVDSKRPEVMICDQSRNVYGSSYHVREPKTQILEQTIETFVAAARNWSARKVFVQVCSHSLHVTWCLPGSERDTGLGRNILTAMQD